MRDAFLLERMRPACDERDFDRSLLGFCRTRDGHLVEGGVHEGAITEFVREARKFIWATSFLMEDYAWREGDGSCLARLEALLERGAKGWPMLAELAMAHPETPDTESVRLQLADEEGDPKAGWRWSAEVTGKKLEGETSSTGVLEVVLPRGVKSFGLKVVAPDQSSEESYELELAG
ncbi:MAG: hypothetical protein JST92_23420 [Deltaproteobacteria bacterium]|nr:hypothetical protein [Deltaproteobacteria bacterium]